MKLIDSFKKFFTNKKVIVILFFIFGLIALSYLDSCHKNKWVTKEKYNALLLLNQGLVQEKNKLNQTVYSQDVIITSTQKNIKSLVEENFNLKAKSLNRIKTVDAYAQIKTSTQIKDVSIPYKKDTTISFTINNCPDNYIPTPKYVQIDSLQNPNFQFSAMVGKDSLKIRSINIPDTQNIAIVRTKGGFFKRDIKGKLKFYRKSSIEIKVLHTNPYIKVTGMSSIIYKPPNNTPKIIGGLIIATTAILTTIKLLR